eukprot:Skav226090  [mRNA]  locus=scaffold4179:11702:17005:- [translate_table: standard]
MSAIYIHAGAVAGGVNELKSVLLQLMHPMKSEARCRRLDVAIGITARFVVRHDLTEEEAVVKYIISLFPCGAVAPSCVERADGSDFLSLLTDFDTAHSVESADAMHHGCCSDWLVLVSLCNLCFVFHALALFGLERFRLTRKPLSDELSSLLLPATMGGGASTEHKSLIEGKSPEEIAAALKELPADQLSKIWAAVDKNEPCPGPVDCSSIKVVAKDYKGMLEQPSAPKYKGALAQIYVRSQPYGGSDKSNNGHRCYDSIPIVNGMISAGMSCQLIHYTHEEHDKFFELCKSFDYVIVRCNPGQIKADGGDQQKFDDGMRALRKMGKQVWPSPDVMEKMGAKDALCKVATMNIGLEDTLAYYSPEEFTAGFKKTMAFQPRVIKQNRGSSGEGIWIIKLKDENYCKEYGERSCEDGEKLILMEANDNHEEEHTVAEFIEFCVHGRTDKSGEWTSKGVGKYLEGGKDAGGQLVDQRFCPRIVEGELRYNLIGDSLIGVIHKKPKEGGISAVGGTGSIYTFYGPDEPLFASLTENFLKKDLPHVMPSLDLAEEPLPLWWTTDFINASPPGTKAEDEKWIVGEFNCSCVGISRCLAAYCKDDTPNASWDDISEEDKAEAKKMGDLMGEKALAILSK